MRQFPAFFNLSGQRVVIVGNGEEALRKLRLFVSAGAHARDRIGSYRTSA
jgi:uroporphyrin-III C-methyltransferase/precorrin-2 dehydrogenase/sirohydrochlorin ferrochelatase